MNMNLPPSYQAILLQPPPGDLTGPYPALCYLKSYAASQGYQVLVKDLGIEALHYLSHPEQVARMLGTAQQQCDDLESNTILSMEQQQHYNLLLGTLAMQDHPQWYAKTIRLFQNAGTFFNYRSYRQARTALNAFFQLLSALHFPISLTAADYPTATQLKGLDAILAHQNSALNPYIQYYEAVVFPMITRHRPSLVGISMVFGNQSVQALVLGRMIKTRFPEIHVTLGGAYLSQWVMAAGDLQVAQLLTCADSIICGEGEQSFTLLLKHIQQDQSLAGLPNLVYSHGAEKKVMRCESLVYTDVTIQPPPDFSDLELDAYLTPETIIPYCISRGCYWGRCVFCQNRYGDHQLRRYQTVPVDKAVAEINDLADQYNSQHFNFSNDVIDPKYLKNLSQALLAGGRSFTWHTDLRAEKAFDAPTCNLMASAGLKSVAIGFESGCQKTLNAMDKGKHVPVMAEVLRHLYTAGVATQAMGIFGMPGETEDDGQETVHFLENNADFISYYVMGLLMVLPGSRMHSDPSAYGVTDISYADNPLKTPEPIWRSPTRMSVDSVNRLYERLNRLEQVFAINEYPYVGGLSTNHGFLYYTLGPDILKRLRMEEKKELAAFHKLLENALNGDKRCRKNILHMQLPHRFYRSRFALQNFAQADDRVQRLQQQPSGLESTYLLLPGQVVHTPVKVEPQEVNLLNRIDGRRSLGAVLKNLENTHISRAFSFLMFLFQAEAVQLSKSRSKKH